MSLATEAAIRAALETHLAGTVLCATGSRTDLSATATGYARAAGSFVADGFRVGDTVLPGGFADAAPAVVLAVADGVLVVDREVGPEPAGAVASLAVVLPARRRFEGQPFVKPKDKPWLRAALRPMPGPLVAFGRGGIVRHQGSFAVELVEPVDSGLGLARVERLAAALCDRFRPGLRLSHGGLEVRLGNARRWPIQEGIDALTLHLGFEWACEVAA